MLADRSKQPLDKQATRFWNEINGGGIAGKPFSVTQLTSDFELIGEYDMPEKKNISSFNVLFTDDKVLFPYMGGEYIGENNMAFYGLKL